MAGSQLPINLLTSANVLRMLNVRYVLWPDQLGAPADQGLPADIINNLRRLNVFLELCRLSEYARPGSADSR